jgi:hypothetical protein
VKEECEDFRECRRNRAWAEAAWEQVCRMHPGEHFAEDHAKGFQAGFTEHLYRGTVAPPPLPPACYRTVRYQTPEGYRAIESWFAGFRHGVSVAQAGGYRDCVTGPSAFRAPAAVLPGLPPPGSPSPVAHAPGSPTPTAAQKAKEGGEKELRIRLEWTPPFSR